jgi:PAS domain S-box-containing protein
MRMTALAGSSEFTPFASDGFFRNALESSPDCVEILDLSGKVQFVNRSGVALLGIADEAALLGASWLKLWAEADQPTAQAALDVAARGEPQRFMGRVETAGGAVRHMDNIVSPLNDGQGAPGAMLVTSRDMTEFEEARLAAEEREREAALQAAVLRSAAEMAKLGGWEMDFREGMVYRSEECLRLLGGGPAVVPIDESSEGYDPDDLEPIRRILERARDTGERVSFEAPFTRRDGVRAWIRVFGEGAFEDGVCVGLRGAAMDISEEKAAQDAIQRAEQRLLVAIQLAGLRVYDLDFTTHTLTHHGAAPVVLDREPVFEDIWPPGANTYMHPLDREQVQAQWAGPDAGVTPIRSEFRVLRANGDVRWAFTVAKMVRDAAGQPLRLLTGVMDITERKRAELEMLQTMAQMREHEERQKLLLGELNHRVKNTLASVQSVAMQTLTDTHDTREARELLLERLMALSSTHNLLVKHAWEAASFHELADLILSPYGRPYAVRGPDLRLDPNFAVCLGMALHELTTNALKHGSWRAAGRIDVEVVEPGAGRVSILWRESGGPDVEPPVRRGFGSRLLLRGVAGELGGQVNLDFARTGLVCTVDVPLSCRLQVARREPA